MNQDVTVRLAVPRDATKIATMARDLVERGPDWEWTEQRVRAAIHRKDTIAPVACVGNAMAGFGLIRVGFDQAHLDLLAVRPGRRKMGIGRTLVEWLEQSMLVAGVGIVRVEVQPERHEVQAFFRNLGYRQWHADPAGTKTGTGPLHMAHDLWCPPVMDEVR
ncbi:GNAT family N-acetyltransferase [Ectothiorhodospiraceae bacterium WFHF3C12]|nr:GNAT family N-acetyltransferase [Ectothiorhodospiraceae bacterium WFHF3C12]